MRQTLLRQLVITLAVLSYVAQAGAVASVAHGTSLADVTRIQSPLSAAETGNDPAAHSQVAHGQGHPGDSHSANPTQHSLDLRSSETHQFHSGDDDCCIQQCDCCMGHCFSAAALSDAPSLVDASCSAESVYIALFPSTAIQCLFKPPIIR